MTLDAFLQTIVEDPQSAGTTWLVLADWLEDQGDPRAELVRLLHQPDYRRDWPGERRDERVRELLASGVGSVAPTLVNSIGMNLVLIPKGVFMMGSPDDEGEDDEHPRHEVEITRPFFMGSYQLTQEEYQRVMGKNPSYFCATGGGKDGVKKLDTKHLPVETVSWEEAMAFCETLSKLPEEKKAGRVYRLPTEAEWEYSCRGGVASYSPYHFGATLSPKQANFHDSKLSRPCPVGSYPANGFGLFDMHGNIWEWCLDWYDDSYSQEDAKRDSQGPESGECRVLRGGSWGSLGYYCRAADRNGFAPGDRHYYFGFRVCCLLDL